MTFFVGNFVRFTAEAQKELKLGDASLPYMVSAVFTVPSKAELAEHKKDPPGAVVCAPALPPVAQGVTQEDIGHHQLVKVVGSDGLFSGRAFRLA